MVSVNRISGCRLIIIISCFRPHLASTFHSNSNIKGSTSLKSLRNAIQTYSFYSVMVPSGLNVIRVKPVISVEFNINDIISHAPLHITYFYVSHWIIAIYLIYARPDTNTAACKNIIHCMTNYGLLQSLGAVCDLGFTVELQTRAPELINQITWWRHQMETFSALLAFCAGEFPTQRPVTRCFDVFFDLHLNKRLSKQWWGWWFEKPSCSLWRHCNDPNSKNWKGRL